MRAVGLALTLVLGCSSAELPAAAPEPVSLEAGQSCRPGTPLPGVFTESALKLGVDYVHTAFPPPDRDDAGGWAVEDFPGVGLGDLDGDGALDLVFADGGAAMVTYLTAGRGPGRFTRRDLLLEDPTRVVTIGDLDADGDRDLAVVTRGEPVWLENDGLGNFGGPVPLLSESAPDVSVFSLALGDLVGDGRLELLLGVQQVFDEAAGTSRPAGERLLTAVDGGWQDLTALLPGQPIEDLTFLASLADLDDDGDLDLYETNDARDSGGKGVGNRLVANLGAGAATQFVDATSGSGGGIVTSGMGAALGDYDNDGLLDIYVTAMTPDLNTLLRNSGSMRFEDVTAAAGADTLRPAHDVGWGAVFFDADMDGALDLFVTHGFIETSDFSQRRNLPEQANVLLKGDTRAFEDVTERAQLGGVARSRSPVVGDINRDGFPDLVVGNVDAAPYVYLNGCDGRPWLTVRLEGSDLNRDGIGAKVVARSAGLSQTRQVLVGSDGLYGSRAPEAYFGFAAGTERIDVEVRWPRGETRFYPGLPVRHIITLRLGSP